MILGRTTTALLFVSTLATLTSATIPVPLIIWHGLGDNYDNDGLKSVAELYTSIYPNASTHIIALGEDPGADRKASYFGSLNDELDLVCDQLASNPALSSAAAPHGVHAIGFSQGGVFMRSYVERCNSPKVHTLVTFGSPHNGIAEFVKCGATDWLCRTAFGFLNANKYSTWVQSNVVPAQYFRDPRELDAYLDNSGFLADINNERAEKNETYSKNLGEMEGGIIMYKFDEDQVIIPKESVWFAEVKEDKITWLTDRKLYREDWLGFKKLDEAKKLQFLKTDGQHMHITDELLKDLYIRLLWQPEGVVAREVDTKAYRESLAGLAVTPPEDDLMLHAQPKHGPVWLG